MTSLATSKLELDPAGIVPGWDTDPESNLAFVGSKYGWAYNTTTLWQTSDGGTTWQLIKLPLQTPHFIIGQAHPVAEGQGWVWTSGSGYHVFHTTDGGAHWREWRLPPLRAWSWVSAVWLLLDGKTGWLKAARHSGGYGPGQFYGETVYRSDDEGAHWRLQLTRRDDTGVQYSQGPTPLYFSDSQHGLLETLQGYWVTKDGGLTWKESEFAGKLTLEERGDSEVVSIFFLNGSVGWTLGSKGALWKTTDGGLAWRLLRRPGGIWPPRRSHTPICGCISWYGMFLDTPGHGWLVGGDCNLYETHSGGATWSRVAIAKSFFSLACDPTATNCWVTDDETGRLYRIVVK